VVDYRILSVSVNIFLIFTLTGRVRILELANNMKSLWKSRSEEERVELLKLLLSNQQLNGKAIEISLHSPFQVLRKIRDFKEMAKKAS